MKSNKKVYFKNRVKCFYTEPDYRKNRIKNEDTGLFQDDAPANDELEQPEEEGDLS